MWSRSRADRQVQVFAAFILEIRYHQVFTWEIPQNDVSRSFPNRNLVNDEHSYGTGIEYLYIYIKLFFF